MENRTIVYVEDEPHYQQLVTRILGKAGWAIHVAGTGREGLDLLERHRPDLLILDINLPDTDGFAMCRELRRINAWKDLPILMLTVRRQAKEWLKGFSCGANDYVSKPINPPEFKERAETCLAQKAIRPVIGYEDAEYQLIQAAIAGNKGAFEVLIRESRPRLLNAMTQHAGNADKAEDIVAAAYMTAYERLRQFRGDASFSTWLYEIALNESRRRWREDSPLSLHELSAESGEEVLGQEDPQLTRMDREPDLARVKAAAGSIPSGYQKVLELRFIDDIPHEAIARRLAIPTGTVWSRINTAKQLLRKAWRRHMKRQKLA